MREIAQRVRVPLASEHCRANIVVSFTGDGASLTKILVKRSPRSFAEVSSDGMTALLNGKDQIRWWYSTAVRGGDGRELTQGPAIAAPTGGEGGTSVIPDKPSLNVYTSSMVETYAVRALTRATVVVDLPKATGKSLTAVADYTALVAFAEVRPQRELPENSILRLFDAEHPTSSLTARDEALLAALYRIPLNRSPAQQRGALAREIASRVD